MIKPVNTKLDKLIQFGCFTWIVMWFLSIFLWNMKLFLAGLFLISLVVVVAIGNPPKEEKR